MKDWNLSRRDLLKTLGIGAACIPLVNVSRAFAAGESAQNLGLLIVASTEGYRFQTGKFNPNVGPLTTQMLPDTLSPLQMGYPACPAVGGTAALPAVPAMDLRGDINVILNLTMPTYSACNNCGHHCYAVAYYGGPQAPTAGNYQAPSLPGEAGYTVDQVVASYFGGPSLPLQAQATTYLGDGGDGCHYAFWKGVGAPVSPIMDPATVYQQLFTNLPMGPSMPGMPAKPDPAVIALLARKKSILDYVGGDIQRFASRLGTTDNDKVQGHLSSIRDIETQITKQLMNAQNGSSGGTVNPGTLLNPADFAADKAGMNATPPWAQNNVNYPQVVALQFKLAVAALATGAARVVTVQIGDATGDAHAFHYIPGVQAGAMTGRGAGDWHAISHNPVNGGTDTKQLIDKWFMGQFASLVQQMKAVPINGGTLLDNSLLLWGNHMQSGDTHDPNHVPWMLAGNAGGFFKTGQCVDGGPTMQPVNGVLAAICQAMGVPGSATSNWTGKTFGTAQYGAPYTALHA
jgi:hypothetical protein